MLAVPRFQKAQALARGVGWLAGAGAVKGPEAQFVDSEPSTADVAADLLEDVILAALADADLERADAVCVGLARQADGPLLRGYDLLRSHTAIIYISPRSHVESHFAAFARFPFCSFPRLPSVWKRDPPEFLGILRGACFARWWAN